MVGRVLVVDDDSLAQAIYVIALRSQGYSVEAVGCAKEALQRLRSENFDALVSDVMMPNIDGIELARAVRREEHGSDLPILLVTALDDRETRIRALEFADAIIAKAVDLTELYLCLRTLMRRRLREMELRDAVTLRERTGLLPKLSMPSDEPAVAEEAQAVSVWPGQHHSGGRRVL